MVISHLDKLRKILIYFNKRYIGDALRDLVPFVQLKKCKNTHRGVLLLVKLQALACNFTKSNTLPWMFFKLYKCYQIAQRTTYVLQLIQS